MFAFFWCNLFVFLTWTVCYPSTKTMLAPIRSKKKKKNRANNDAGAVCHMWSLPAAWAGGQIATQQHNGFIHSDLLNTPTIGWISNTFFSILLSLSLCLCLPLFLFLGLYLKSAVRLYVKEVCIGGRAPYWNHYAWTRLPITWVFSSTEK